MSQVQRSAASGSRIFGVVQPRACSNSRKVCSRSNRTAVQQQLNKAHNRVRAIGERGNSLLKMTFKALRNVSLNPTSELGKPHNVRECVPASDDHRGDGALQDVLFIRNVQLVHGQPDT